MGLRILNNVAVTTALRNLTRTNAAQNKSFERLSSGEKLNSAKDDPSGLSLSERLRSEIAALRTVTETAGRTANLLATTESAFDQLDRTLIDIRQSVIAALNSGALDQDAVAAEQASVDQAIAAIDDIVRTTRFGEQRLLDGTQAIRVVEQDAQILEVQPTSARLGPSTGVSQVFVEVLSAAERATLSGVGPTGVVASGGEVSIRLEGPRGASILFLASGANFTELANAVNTTREQTGLFASAGDLFTEDFGSRAFVRIDQIGGSGVFTGANGQLNANNAVLDNGLDAQARIGGVDVAADGNVIQAVTSFLTAEITLASDSGISPPGGFRFALADGGLSAQLGTRTDSTERASLAIPDLSSGRLGIPEEIILGIIRGGFLNSLTNGGTNNLSSNPQNALKIVDAAFSDVLKLREEIGSFGKNRINNALDQSDQLATNLTLADALLRDTDFAQESANLARNQVLFQAGTNVLAQALNITPDILRLLTG